MKVPSYVFTPILGLIDRWPFKLPISVSFAVLWEALNNGGEIVETLFQVDPILAGMAVAAYLGDWITGLGRALWDHGLAGVRSNEFRHAGWKLIEYCGVVGVCVLLTNGTAHTWAAPGFSWLNEAGFIYVAVTEGFSIWENVTRRKRGAGRVMMDLSDLMSGDWEKILERRRDRKNGGTTDESLERSRPIEY
jgi:hypothetical protein